LQKHGFDVATAEDLDEALFRARRLPKTPSLVITDMVLPDATGQDIAFRLRSLFGQLPILFISGYSTAEDLHVDLRQLENLLPKPFSPAELIANVARLLGD
jgi:DNA-binding response OmpR family regulator